MKFFRVSNIALMFFILLISTAGAYAQQNNGPPPPSAGLCTDGQSLFVMLGATMYQYSLADLSLITTVTLPKPDPQTDSDNPIRGNTNSDNETQPPHPPAGSGLCTDGTYLFMLRGHSIHQYTISDMRLVKSVELPKPEPPTAD